MDNLSTKILKTSGSDLIEKITLKKILNKTNICLYGPPGAGKTTTSKILGQRLKMEVYDVDDDHLERDWNMTVAEKLKLLGDEKFIEAEGGNNQKIITMQSVPVIGHK